MVSVASHIELHSKLNSHTIRSILVLSNYMSLVLRAGNVLLTSCDSVPHGFRAKISDFGLARNLSIQSKIETRTYGTITHMPLELLCDGIMSKVGLPPSQDGILYPV